MQFKNLKSDLFIILIYWFFSADSTTGTKRKGYKYLDGARVDVRIFFILFLPATIQSFDILSKTNVANHV